MEILDLSDAQQERFLKAYDIAKELMRDLDIFPAKGDAEQERLALETDEFERGYPRMTLSLLMDVVGACLAKAEKGPKEGRGKKDKDEEDDAPPAFESRTAALRSSEGKAKLAASAYTRPTRRATRSPGGRCWAASPG